MTERPALRRGCCHELTQRTALLASPRGPEESVLAARIAPERSGIKSRRLSIVPSRGIELLCRDVSAADTDDRQLVAADSSVEDFLFSRGRVELPAAGDFGEWNRKRPSLVADDEHLAIASLVDEQPSLGGRGGEHVAIATGGRRIRGVRELLSVGSEDRDDVLLLPGFDRLDERFHGVLGRREGSSGRRRRFTSARDERHQRRAGERHQGHDRCRASRSHRRRPPPPRELLRLRCPR